MKRSLIDKLVIASLVIFLTSGVAMAQSTVDTDVSPEAQRIETRLDSMANDINDPLDNGTLGLAPADEAHSADGKMAADMDAHHENGDHAQTGGLPQLDPTWFASQIFWLLLVFGFMYFLFSRNILPSISNTLENRHEHVQGDLDTANRLKMEAEAVHAAYEQGLEKARNRANTLYREVEDDIKTKSEQQQDELRQRLQNETDLAEARIAKTKNEALSEMTSIAAEIASEAALKIVGIDTDIQKARNVVEDLNSKSRKAA